MKVDALFVGLDVFLYIESGTLLLRTHGAPVNKIELIDCRNIAHAVTQSIYLSVYLILSYLILSYHIISYLIISYLILPYLTLSYLILSYLISSYPIHHRDTSRDTSILLALLISMCAFSA